MVSAPATRRGLGAFATTIAGMASAARDADAAGFDTVWTAELYNRSATVTVAAMAGVTARARLGSGIIYGVGRSPLMLAADVGDAASWYDRDTIAVPERPGLGIDVDETAVRRVAEAWWTVAG